VQCHLTDSFSTRIIIKTWKLFPALGDSAL
jgi:hypothetical protein